MIRWADFPSGSQGIYGDDEGLLLNGVYAEINGALVDDPDPLIGATGRAFQINSGHSTYLRRVFGATVVTAFVGFRIWLPNLPVAVGDAPHFQITDTLNDIHCEMRINPDGSISVFKDNVSGTLLASTVGPVIVANAWQHIAWKFYNNAAGNTSIEIEGTSVLDFDGNTATGSTGLAQIRLNSNGAPTAVLLKDFVMWDGLGDVANDFIGPCGVYYLKPIADVSSGWSRTGGASDFAILDNVPPNDAAYISAEEDPEIPAPSIVTCAPLPDDIVAVRAVLPIIRARKSDGGEGKLQMSLVSEGDEDLGADRAISTAFTYWWDVSHYDPSTLAPWAPGAVDNVQFKINRTL
jgi:hypothetical protein